MRLISAGTALASYRSSLTGRRALELLRAHGGQLLIQLPVGVGKSRWMDKITSEAIRSRQYDLVVVLCPTRQLINERVPLRDPPAGVRVKDILPRPSKRCGPKRDAKWKQYEGRDLGALGRAEICGSCPHRNRCHWPNQYGTSLAGVQIVYATQTHLERCPSFVKLLETWIGAERPLLLLDESNFIATSFEHSISRNDLRMFVETLTSMTRYHNREFHRQWRHLAETLLNISTVHDLQDSAWRMPSMWHDWIVDVQRCGVQLFGDDYRFVGYQLKNFGISPVDTRYLEQDGTIRFALRPYCCDCIVFSGATNIEFASFRLGRNLASPFSDYRFIHPKTRWYNIASSIGTRRHFTRHAPQVLDYFAALIRRRVSEGKHVLLIAKKCFADLCAIGLTQRFDGVDLDVQSLKNEDVAVPNDPRTIPLITYGMLGTNIFEHFDCAYCLTGFYINESVINHCLQDLTRQDLRLPIQIETVGNPKRRRASVIDPNDRYYDTAWLAQPALEQQEHNVVIQAVGRVRPFTRPREIITFQMAALPGVKYNAEFKTLGEARRYFKISKSRERKKAETAARIRTLRANGHSQAETARLLGLSPRQIRRYEKEWDRT